MEREVRNCTECGQVFQSVMGIKLCPACLKKEDEKFRMIKDYLYDYPGASMDQVSEALDVSKRTLLRYLKEGRLETIGETMVLQCEHCGTAIRYGKFCKECARDMSMDMKSAAKTLQKDKKSKGFYSKHKK